MEEHHSHLLMISIVAIVAIVGIIVLMLIIMPKPSAVGNAFAVAQPLTSQAPPLNPPQTPVVSIWSCSFNGQTYKGECRANTADFYKEMEYSLCSDIRISCDHFGGSYSLNQ
jgi:hypothetical protein